MTQNPTSRVAIVNYAPLQMLVHSLAWQAFGAETFGHHVLNLALHTLASLLLVVLLTSSGVAQPAAVLAGAAFLVHPANVEAVAWVSQLKSVAALVLGFLTGPQTTPSAERLREAERFTIKSGDRQTTCTLQGGRVEVDSR